jgi:hypothetical protein
MQKNVELKEKTCSTIKIFLLYFIFSIFHCFSPTGNRIIQMPRSSIWLFSIFIVYLSTIYKTEAVFHTMLRS